MIAQALLTILLGAVLLYAYNMRRRAPAITFAATLAALLALWFVWVPAHATMLAHAAGIGRGVDLVLYLWVVISLIMLLSLNLKLRAQMEVITQLARRMALEEASRTAARDEAAPPSAR